MPPTPQATIRVYNISNQAGVGGRVAAQLRDGGLDVAEVGSTTLPQITDNTVFYSDAPGEHATAEAVGRVIGAPVEPRSPDVAGLAPGVIVVVAN